MEHVAIESINLTNGISIPLIGLGTFQADDSVKLTESIKYAVSIGYRHFDLAWLYGNEDVIGAALRSSIEESNGALKREDFFLVSKVWNTFHSKELVKECLNETLTKLGFDYIDLYLIHWPIGLKANSGIDYWLNPKGIDVNQYYSDVHYIETYCAIEELVKENKIKHIGLSNFNVSQLQDVLNNCEIKPINNQIEVHPYLQNDKVIEFCQKNEIIVSCYGPIGAGLKSTNRPELKILLENDVLVSIANKYNKSPAQICLRWGIQRGLVMLPKSTTLTRIAENAQVFDFKLTDEDMIAIKGINANYRIYGQVEFGSHKFYPFHEQ